MLPDINGIIIIAGNYGSGKSETAVNLAAVSRRAGKSVKITDLDLVNPYFRSREAQKPLEDLGVEVVLPDKKYMHADLPILLNRLSDLEARGVAIDPSSSIDALYKERAPLYEKFCDIKIACGQKLPGQVTADIAAALAGQI